MTGSLLKDQGSTVTEGYQMRMLLLRVLMTRRNGYTHTEILDSVNWVLDRFETPEQLKDWWKLND
jgi:hypothetical protein